MSGCQDKSYRCIWKDTCQMGFRKQTKYCEIHKDPRSIWRTSFYQCVLWELLGKLKENSFTINHSNNCIECSHIQDECNFLTLLEIIFFFFFSISDPLYLYPFTFPSQTHSSEWVKHLKNPSALPELLGCFACLLTGQPIHIQHFCQHRQRNEKKKAYATGEWGKDTGLIVGSPAGALFLAKSDFPNRFSKHSTFEKQVNDQDKTQYHKQPEINTCCLWEHYNSPYTSLLTAYRLHLICLLSTLGCPALVIQILVKISRSTVGTIIILVLLYKFLTLNLVSVSAMSLQQSLCKFKLTQKGCTFSFHEHP